MLSVYRHASSDKQFNRTLVKTNPLAVVFMQIRTQVKETDAIVTVYLYISYLNIPSTKVMSSPGALTGILRSQTRPDLDSINRELCDGRIKKSGGKEAYIQRLRRSLKNSIETGTITWDEFVEELQAGNEAYTKTKIRHQIEEMVFSKTASYKDGTEALEHYITAEVFQALRLRFEGTNVTVQDEKYHNKDVNRPDITVVDEADQYIVEIKTSSKKALDTLSDQMRKYQRADGFRWLFIVYVTTKPRMTLEQNTKRKRMFDGFSGHYDNFKLIEKSPDDFRSK